MALPPRRIWGHMKSEREKRYGMKAPSTLRHSRLATVRPIRFSGRTTQNIESSKESLQPRSEGKKIEQGERAINNALPMTTKSGQGERGIEDTNGTRFPPKNNRRKKLKNVYDSGGRKNGRTRTARNGKIQKEGLR